MPAKRYNKIAGFTLPELMISMVIVAIVMTMAIGIYVNMKNQYNRLNEKHKINTEKLIVKQIFYNAIGGAGFASKYGDMHQELVDNSGDNFGDIFGKLGTLTIGKAPIEDAKSLPQGLILDPELCQQRLDHQEELKHMNIQENIHCVEPDSDYIIVQRSSLDSSLKTNSSNNIFKINEFQKDTSPEKDISMNDYLVLCNSFECNLVKTGAVTLDFVSTTRRVGDKFKNGDYVGKYMLEVFFVADSGKKDKKGKKVYSLYEYIKQNSDDSMTYELVNNVSDLQIEYVLNSEIKKGNTKLNWQKVKKDPVKVKGDNIAALKISFKVSGQSTSKIFLIGAS